MPEVPAPPEFLAWRTRFREAVVEAAHRSDNLAWVWILKVEEVGITFEDLADSGFFPALERL